jgi:hypothetical protein
VKRRKCDYDEVKAGALVKRLGQDLPELLSFFPFSRHLWK